MSKNDLNKYFIMVILLFICKSLPSQELLWNDNGTLERLLTDDGIRYIHTDDTITIIGYDRAKTELIIPEKINNLTVKTVKYAVIVPKGFLGGVARREHGNLRNVTIPNTVITIGKDAFYDDELESIVIPNSVISIEGGAFGRNNLAELIIPDNVIVIGTSSFAQNKINKLIIGVRVSEIGAGAFAENQITDIIIPSNVRKIGPMAFDGNKITKITIGNNVEFDEFVLQGYYEGYTFGDQDYGETFYSAYTRNNKYAGTYVYNASKRVWEYSR
jgi:hypothetical protein